MEGQIGADRIEACRQAIYSFFDHLDAGRFDEVSAHMAQDGTWHRQGETLTGPGEVAAALARRSPTVVTAHVIDNLILRAAGSDEIEARYVLTVYAHDAGAAPAGPAPLEGPAFVRRGSDRLVSRKGRWLVLRKESAVVFQRRKADP